VDGLGLKYCRDAKCCVSTANVLYMNIEDKFKSKYRVPSARLQNRDYSAPGYYYVTICTYNKINYFGDIKNGEMRLSDVGDIADEYWLRIPEHYPFVGLDAYVVMPNHIHGIVIIPGGVETQHFASRDNQYRNKFGPQSNNLSSIIRGYKVGVKKWAVLNDVGFVWQPRFYDHIIRKDRSLDSIRKYILENPLRWDKDEENIIVKKENKCVIKTETQNVASLQR